jgi:hypothetical protein
MYQYQYQAERIGWIRYIRTVGEHVRVRFGTDISGDLSVLHEPISACLKVFSRTFTDVRSADKKYLTSVLAIEELGLNDDATVSEVQLQECSNSVSCLVDCARKAQHQMKKLLEPKTVAWDAGGSSVGLSEVPSAEFAFDPGVKGEDQVQLQLRHGGELNRFTSVARLKLVFKDCKSLLLGLEELQEVFELTSLMNCFANPSALGYRTLYAVVKVQIDEESAPAMAEEQDRREGQGRKGSGSHPVYFLAQIQLQLARYEQAEQEAAVHHQAFMDRIPDVCRRIRIEDRPAVEHLIAELIRTIRPSSAVHAACFFSHSSAISVGRVRTDANTAAAHGRGDASGRTGFTSASHGMQIQDSDSDVLELEHPLLDTDDFDIDQWGSGDMSDYLIAEHSSQADTVWYDVRWVIEYQSSPTMMLAQDMLVLAKTLAASVALFYVTRPHQLIVCEGVSYTATESLGCLDEAPCRHRRTSAIRQLVTGQSKRSVLRSSTWMVSTALSRR